MSEAEIIQLVGQGIGFVAFGISCIKYFKKKKSEILKISVIAYIIYIIHYILIGAIAGSYTLVIGLLRDSYIYAREKHHKKHRTRIIFNNFLVFVLFIVAYATLIIFNLDTPTNILPLAAGMVYICFEWFTTNKTTLKFASGLTNIPWIFYNLITMSIAGFLTDSLSLVVCAFGILKDKKLRKHKVKNNY